ncbi:hypothetical protein [Burkholderia stagnalis]|uniref:hypothetical protein n=1 Tax=Burkholderia stagnalis TaxID=1503054 RepID=UPI000AA3F16C|nr:hypothetical protein [Burkholderia stagnalis]
MLKIELPHLRSARTGQAPRAQGNAHAILRAQAKRERKARKLRWDNSVHRGTYYFTRDAAVAEEARRVHDLFDAGCAA